MAGLLMHSPSTIAFRLTKPLTFAWEDQDGYPPLPRHTANSIVESVSSLFVFTQVGYPFSVTCTIKSLGERRVQCLENVLHMALIWFHVTKV